MVSEAVLFQPVFGFCDAFGRLAKLACDDWKRANDDWKRTNRGKRPGCWCTRTACCTPPRERTPRAKDLREGRPGRMRPGLHNLYDALTSGPGSRKAKLILLASSLSAIFCLRSAFGPSPLSCLWTSSS